MLRKRKQPPPPSKLDLLSQDDLIALLEAQMMRNGELFRGLFHKELDQEWVLEQMATHAETAVLAIHALQRKVAVVQSV
jgi:hypothetical protein